MTTTVVSKRYKRNPCYYRPGPESHLVTTPEDCGARKCIVVRARSEAEESVRCVASVERTCEEGTAAVCGGDVLLSCTRVADGRMLWIHTPCVPSAGGKFCRVRETGEGLAARCSGVP